MRVNHVSILYPYISMNHTLPQHIIDASTHDSICDIQRKISQSYKNIIAPRGILIFKKEGSRDIHLFSYVKPFTKGVPSNLYFAYDDTMPANYLNKDEKNKFFELHSLDKINECDIMVTCPICMDNKISTNFKCGHYTCYPCLYQLVIRNPDAICPVCCQKMETTMSYNITGGQRSIIG